MPGAPPRPIACHASAPASQSANRLDFRFGGPDHHVIASARWPFMAAVAGTGNGLTTAAPGGRRSMSGVGGSAMPCGLVLPAARANVTLAAWLPDVRERALSTWYTR